MKKQKIFTAVVILFILSFTTGSFIVPISNNGELNTPNDIDIKEFTSIAEEAYLYGFPMVMNYKVLLDFFVNKESGQYKAPINQIHNEARVFTPADTAISTPNSDTPYSMAQLDLRAEPMVLCVPEIDSKRYYDIQLVDMYTNNYGYIGSRTTGNGAGCFIIAGPDWKGEKPDNIKSVFNCETQFSLVVIRTQLFNPQDMDNVKKVQAGYKLQPLSEYLGTTPPPPAPEIKWIPFKDGFTKAFPVYLNFVLQFCPATGTAAVEKPLREKFAKIGITGEQPFDPSKYSKEELEAWGGGIKAAFQKIEHTAENLGTVVNGWQIGSAAGSREFYNGDWALRSAAAKLGIYGNSSAEAVYPFTHNDVNNILLDGSKHNYTLTFEKDKLPPVKAFWSITMYDSKTQFLIENSINRYLINSPMLPDLKKNDDGSLTIYIQHESPGKDKESNWLPSPDGPMFVVMRMYWPNTDPPSVLPLGKGTWAPPGIVPVQNLNAVGVTRFGDRSIETIVRTDERYGHDRFFQGPRGWMYRNFLEYPKPIQYSNLWPDTKSCYFLGRVNMPAGSSLTIKFTFPRARYFNFSLYKFENRAFVSTGEKISGKDIVPDAGSINPFVVGAYRLGDERNFTLTILAEDKPSDASKRLPNTLYAGKDGGELESMIRIYLGDQDSDGAGWGPASSSVANTGFPTYTGKLADGTILSSEEVVKQFVKPIVGETKTPITTEQWVELIHAKDNDPTLDLATSPARPQPKWEKYWTNKYSIIGAFKTPEDRAKIPYEGAIDGGGDPSTQYFLTLLSRKYGAVYVMKGKMPTFPNTFAGVGGKGLEIMPEAQTQYWSIVSCEAAPSGIIVDGLTDFQIPLDEDGYYTIVCSRKEDRPKNATLENGIAWIEWSPRGEGLETKQNRTDFGMLMLRIMDNNPTWKESPNNVTKPGMEEEIMGPYLPVGKYFDKASFEAMGKNIKF